MMRGRAERKLAIWPKTPMIDKVTAAGLMRDWDHLPWHTNATGNRWDVILVMPGVEWEFTSLDQYDLWKGHMRTKLTPGGGLVIV
jgi:hypothetical protein